MYIFGKFMPLLQYNKIERWPIPHNLLKDWTVFYQSEDTQKYTQLTVTLSAINSLKNSLTYEVDGEWKPNRLQTFMTVAKIIFFENKI